MEQYEVQTTRQAEAQLVEIVHYLSHELLEPGIASALLTALEKAMASLSTFPQRAMLVTEEPWSQQGVRKLLCKNFLIYFSVDAVHHQVTILAVVYARRDQLSQLGNLKLDN